MPNKAVTMKVLTETLNSVLQQNQRKDLGTIRTFKRGVLPPAPTFPAIGILPLSEELGGAWGGGRYKIWRRILIECYTKELDRDRANDTAFKKAEIIKDILRDQSYWTHYNVSDVIMDSVYQYGAEALGGSNFEGRAALEVKFYSKEDLPANRIRNGNNHITISDLIKRMKSTMYSFKEAPKYGINLRNIKNIDTTFEPLLPNFPAVTIQVPDSSIDRRFAGADVDVYNFAISVFTKLSDNTSNLDANLKMVDELKKFLQFNGGWNGFSMGSRISTIEYGLNVEEKPPVYSTYQSVINYTVETFKQIN